MANRPQTTTNPAKALGQKISDLARRVRALELRPGGGGLSSVTAGSYALSGTFDSLMFLPSTAGLTIAGGAAGSLAEVLIGLDVEVAVAATLVNGWAAGNAGPHSPGASIPPKFWKDVSGTVHITGGLSANAATSAIAFVLPVDHRPTTWGPSATSAVFPVLIYNSGASPKFQQGIAEVFANGPVHIYDANGVAIPSGTSTLVHLGHIAFQ